MKPSKYNVWMNHPVKPGAKILCNTLFGSLTLWESDEIDIVKEIIGAPDSAHKLASKIFETLEAQKNILEDDFDEWPIIQNRKQRGIEDKNRLDIVIMPTLECNFSCVYCYEERRPGRMSDLTEARIEKWLQAEIPQHKVVMLHWYGGEPLIELERVVSLSRKAVQINKGCGSILLLHVTTNGYLLNSTSASALIESGIVNYQITIDGPPEVHNTMRILKNGEGTFERIYMNIIGLAQMDKRIKISLRINYNEKNLSSIPSLLAMFPASIRGQLRPVYEPIFGDRCAMSMDNIPKADLSDLLTAYYDIARQLGYDVVLLESGIHAGKLVYCYAERENQYIINFNGDVYKCSVGTFRPEDRVGMIGSEGYFVKEDAWNHWMGTALFEEHCSDCLYLPVCMGGCRKMRIQRKGRGDSCALVATNASNLLKHVAFGTYSRLFKNRTELSLIDSK